MKSTLMPLALCTTGRSSAGLESSANPRRFNCSPIFTYSGRSAATIASTSLSVEARDCRLRDEDRGRRSPRNANRSRRSPSFGRPGPATPADQEGSPRVARIPGISSLASARSRARPIRRASTSTRSWRSLSSDAAPPEPGVQGQRATPAPCPSGQARRRRSAEGSEIAPPTATPREPSTPPW